MLGFLNDRLRQSQAAGWEPLEAVFFVPRAWSFLNSFSKRQQKVFFVPQVTFSSANRLGRYEKRQSRSKDESNLHFGSVTTYPTAEFGDRGKTTYVAVSLGQNLEMIQHPAELSQNLALPVMRKA